MVIRINIHNEIVWPIIFFLLLKYYGVSGQVLFFVSVIWFLYISVRNNRLLITIPRIHGFNLYFIFFIFAIIIGLMANDTRDVAKDIFYAFPTIMLMMIGYLYNKYDNGKSITKTLYIAGTVITLLSFINLIMDFSQVSDMSILRALMGRQVYETTLIFAIMISEKIVGKRVIFSKIIDWIMIILMMLKGIVSLGRTELIVTIAVVVAVLLLNMYISVDKLGAMINYIVIAIIMLAIGVSTYRVLPESVRSQFVDKLEYSFEEVDVDNEYKTTADAMQHWRAYEIKCAEEQWLNFNLFEQIMGAGFGEYIKIGYIPHNFTDDMVKNNAIALLHNTYYSILVKGGILGTLAILLLYILNVTAIFRPRYKDYKFETCTLCVITIGMIIFTYLVRGIFSQSIIFVWPFMVGWINGKIRNSESKQLNLQRNETI